jgi:rhodanese-related sulfurtransferase
VVGRVVAAKPPGAHTIDEILAEARARLRRLSPADALREQSDGGVLVDIRPASQRAVEGEVPGSVVVERNHLEWRLDPASDARLPWVTGYDHRVIVICQEGYTSSLAAASLHDVGLARATDVIGGFHAWLAGGLPSAPASAGTATIAPGAAAALPLGNARSCPPPAAAPRLATPSASRRA